jgi:hypothetical protein
VKMPRSSPAGPSWKSFLKWRLELQLRELVHKNVHENVLVHENGISEKVGSLTPAHGGEWCIVMKLEGCFGAVPDELKK